MNVRNLKILFWILLCFATFSGKAQSESEIAKIFLFTDRGYCISGDTLWFKVFLKNDWNEKGNVVHVQLNSPGNDLIVSVIKKSRNNWAEGYLYVPDSLSTGVYFLTAFMNAQRSNPDLECRNRTLFVYNRFNDALTEIAIPSVEKKITPEKTGTGAELKIGKTDFSTREKVTVTVDCTGLAAQGVKNIVVKATKINELAEEAGWTFATNLVSANPNIPFLNENDGFVLTGKVTDKETGEPQAGVMVFLSIVSEPPYFDYSVSQEDGGFYFFLKNAEGIANVVLQTVSDNEREYAIQPEENYLVHRQSLPTAQKILSTDEKEFISTALSSSFFRRIFKNSYVTMPDSLNMPPRFSIPFYGKPGEHVVPAEFFDLPDFREISRELLSGVQYREKNDELTFRVVNREQGSFFNDEPLRLINGIPVSKNSLFSALKSTDIDYIDVVPEQRLFGDLIFDGVLAVSLHNKSNMWLAKQPNIFQFSVNCLQRDKTPAYNQPPEFSDNRPDIRQVYLWKTLDTAIPHTFEFYLSDVKGKVEVSVEGVNGENRPVKISKTIEVK